MPERKIRMPSLPAPRRKPARRASPPTPPPPKSKSRSMTVADEPSVRLTVELVPETSWGNNVRRLVKSDVWDRIRRAAYARAGFTCEICGEAGRLECHERWEYDNQKHVQRLTRMVALCPACHEVKHIGLATVRGNGERALLHLARVNGWSLPVAKKHIAEQVNIGIRRSKVRWTLDLRCSDLPPDIAVPQARFRKV